ncbi:RNA polymerase sigma-70 factor [Pedobacter psychrodurus]|uniref:RNA polymerase sigma factor n=1 Tax=Pedobacter psychrodurus TaxID=2530456 RepID=UPI00292E0F9A|nr:RNA polymerase sigma-70 factor [Pedobacter psychrodurus]
MNKDHQLLDSELVVRLKKGSHDAFNQLYKRFFKSLYIHAFKRLGNDEDAIDIVQDLFEFLWTKRYALEIDNFSAYMYTAVRNRIFTFQLRSDRKNLYLNSLKAFIDNGEFVTDDHVRERELTALIEKEIAALPPQMKKVFIMSRTEGLSHKDIATCLGTSEHTVRTQIKRTLKILRARIGIIAYLILIM